MSYGCREHRFEFFFARWHTLGSSSSRLCTDSWVMRVTLKEASFERSPMKQSSMFPAISLSVLHIYQAPHGTHCHYTFMLNRTSCIAHLTNSLLAAFLQ